MDDSDPQLLSSHQPGSKVVKSTGGSSGSVPDKDLPEFKVSTPELTTTAAAVSSSQYAKQLALLAEMGFTDREFNLKTLQAANGNMQDALEIIVAANQRLRKKKSLSQDSWDPSGATVAVAAAAAMATKKHQAPIVDLMDSLDLRVEDNGVKDVVVVKDNTAGYKAFSIASNGSEPFQALDSPAIPTAAAAASSFLDDSNPWAQVTDAKTAETFLDSRDTTGDVKDGTQSAGSQEQQGTEAEEDNNDPLAFNPFKSTTSNHFSDDLFANPW